jgi:hypothetical protein
VECRERCSPPLEHSHSVRVIRKSWTDKMMLRVARPGFDSDRGRDFSRYHHMQTASGTHPAKYRIGVDGLCVKLNIHVPK